MVYYIHSKTFIMHTHKYTNYTFPRSSQFRHGYVKLYVVVFIPGIKDNYQLAVSWTG